MNHPHNPVCKVCTEIEQKRIIKLIEEENKFLYELEIEYVIGLIKGEIK